MFGLSLAKILTNLGKLIILILPKQLLECRFFSVLYKYVNCFQISKFLSSKMSSPGSDSDSSESLFGDLMTNPYNAVDCLGLKEPPKLTLFESRMKSMFTFDRNKYREYSDLRLYSIQSCCRYSRVSKHSTIYSLFCVFGRSYTGYRAERFLQRRICTHNCNWDPSQCFLEDSHSGRLKDLMRTEFLDQ